MKRTSVILYLLLVFASGALVGGVGHWLYATKTVGAKNVKRGGPEEYRKRYISEMRERLNLEEAQVVQLNEILDDTRKQYRETYARIKPDLNLIHEDQVNKIRSILNEKQLPEYQKMREERRSKKKDGC